MDKSVAHKVAVAIFFARSIRVSSVFVSVFYMRAWFQHHLKMPSNHSGDSNCGQMIGYIYIYIFVIIQHKSSEQNRSRVLYGVCMLVCVCNGS